MKIMLGYKFLANNCDYLMHVHFHNLVQGSYCVNKYHSSSSSLLCIGLCETSGSLAAKFIYDINESIRDGLIGHGYSEFEHKERIERIALISR